MVLLGAVESVGQLSRVPQHYNGGKTSKKTHVFIPTPITYIYVYVDSQNPVISHHRKLLFVRFYGQRFGST